MIEATTRVATKGASVTSKTTRGESKRTATATKPATRRAPAKRTRVAATLPGQPTPAIPAVPPSAVEQVLGVWPDLCSNASRVDALVTSDALVLVPVRGSRVERGITSWAGRSSGARKLLERRRSSRVQGLTSGSPSQVRQRVGARVVRWEDQQAVELHERSDGGWSLVIINTSGGTRRLEATVLSGPSTSANVEEWIKPLVGDRLVVAQVSR